VFDSGGFPTFCGRLGGGVTALGMDMVRGLSGFGESEMFCEAGGSDLNNFCCMLRTLVAILKWGEKGKRCVVFKGVHEVHLFAH
jgi:hypothetical protein